MPITDPLPVLPVLAFDFDGVIADSLGLCTAACRTVAADMGWPGMLPDNPFGELEPVTFEALAETCGLDPRAFAAGVTDHVATTDHCAPLVPGMDHLLGTLSTRAEIHILSASSSTVIRRFLDHHGLTPHVTEIHGRDHPGSKTEKLKIILKSHDLRAMIGDATSDMTAAIAAGVPPVGVAWGWQSEDRLTAHGASTVAHSPEELSDHLHRLLQPTR